MTERSRTVDIVVVGAGLSGLRLADRILRSTSSQKQPAVLVLEANDRIGGRMIVQRQTITVEASEGVKNIEVAVDGGAQFIGGTHNRMLDLVKDLGLEAFPAHVEGKFRWAQEIIGPLRFGLSPDTAEPKSFEALRKETEALAATIPLEAPWEAPDAGRLDGQTFDEYLDSTHCPKAARVPYERLCVMHWGCDPTQISALYALFLLHSCGGYQRFVAHDDGNAHQWRIKGGAGQIVEALAERIGRSENIWTGAAVEEIHHYDNDEKGGGAVVRGDGFQVVANKAVVLALQPQLCERIQFEPALPESRLALHQQYLTRQPYTAKVHLVYKRPFWRDKGYSGTGVTSSGVVFVDNSPEDDSGTGCLGILLAFCDRRRKDLTHDRLRGYAATLFGREAGQPLEIVEQDWSREAWSAACISYTPPGLLSQHGPSLRRVDGRLHWAGAETSPEWPSFMEGALQAADRVYDEIQL